MRRRDEIVFALFCILGLAFWATFVLLLADWVLKPVPHLAG